MLLRGLSLGAVMGGAALSEMMISSSIERGSPWAGPNAMLSALRDERVRDDFGISRTLLGAGILIGGMLLWGVGYEGVLRVAQKRPAIVGGLLCGLLAFAFDELVMPEELTKNFRRKLGLVGTIGKYAAIAGATMLATSGVRVRAPSIVSRGLQPEELPLGGEGALRTTLPWGLSAYEA